MNQAYIISNTNVPEAKYTEEPAVQKVPAQAQSLAVPNGTHRLSTSRVEADVERLWAG